jgi:predicted ATPase/DNA-binding SARP family transcriptional activator
MSQPDSETYRGSLPVELTHFVGRERELSALRQLARAARLITLTGAGGSGKSRLALQLVPDLGRTMAGGVAWVELAPIMEPGVVGYAVLRAIGTPADDGVGSADTVAGAIRDRALLLVLDNCEHLVDSCADLVDRLLRACPNLRIIATSREALGVAGERAWLVPPLDLPRLDAPLDVLAGSDAVKLFVDRARDVAPDFALTPSNAPAVAGICARVDGIPLAIELAAARVRHLSPEQIRDRLSDAFGLLTTGARTALPRHRTLRAALDWSHDLLREHARIVLRRLAVFRGGFTLDLAEVVASGAPIETGDVLDLVGVLADRSLVVVREQDDSVRYHLLETMRQYAALRLEESGEARTVERRFAEAMSAYVAQLEPAFTTPARRAAIARLEAELDNIREVLAWSREHEPELHVRLVGMLWWFWYSTRHWVEAYGWITEALALPAAAAPTRDRAAVLFAAGALQALRAQTDEARPLLEAAAALAGSLGDARLEAYALNYIAMTHAATLSPEAGEYAGRAARWLREHGDDYGLRLSLLLGGMAEQGAGNHVGAAAMMEEAVAIARGFGQDRELAVALQTYATLLVRTNETGRAEALFRESLQALRRDPSFLFIARGIEYYACARLEDEPQRAARTFGVAETIRRHIGSKRFAHDEALMVQAIARLRARFGDDEYDRLHAEGMQVQPQEAIVDVLDDTAASATIAVTPDRGRVAADAVPIATAPTRAVAAPPTQAVTETVDLAVRTLGPFEVCVQGTRIDSWPYTKPKELLAFIALQPQGRSRVEIGDALWPGAGPAQVRNSFHVAMHHVRRILGHADWVVLEGERYRINPTITVDLDVTTFQRDVAAALAAADASAIRLLRNVMRIYRGHFLDGEPAGAWRDEVQDRMRRLYCDAGMRLGARLEEAGDVAGAAVAYEDVVGSEPLHEGAHRGLLRTLTQTGRRAHAVRHYERLSALLDELELDAEPETVELYERIRSASIVAPPQ